MAVDATLMVVDETLTLVDGEQGVPTPARDLVARSMVGRSFPTMHFAAILPSLETTCLPHSFVEQHRTQFCSVSWTVFAPEVL
jgi:hypothetical protein